MLDSSKLKEYGPTAILVSPVFLAVVFAYSLISVPHSAGRSSITVELPPARPYDSSKLKQVVVPSRQQVQTETKVVYVDVPAKDGQPATRKRIRVHLPTEVPVDLPEPGPAQPINQTSDLDRIFNEPTIQIPNRDVNITPVQFDRSDHHRFQPDYPQELRANGVEGKVHVRVIVGPDGKPRRIVAVGSPDHRLFEQTQRWGMQNWRFKPATVDGTPSTGKIDVSISFKIADM